MKRVIFIFKTLVEVCNKQNLINIIFESNEVLSKLAIILVHNRRCTMFLPDLFIYDIFINMSDACLLRMRLLKDFSYNPHQKDSRKGVSQAFNNYVDRILPFFAPPRVDSFYTLSVDKNRHFLPPPSSCPRSY